MTAKGNDLPILHNFLSILYRSDCTLVNLHLVLLVNTAVVCKHGSEVGMFKLSTFSHVQMVEAGAAVVNMHSLAILVEGNSHSFYH